MVDIARVENEKMKSQLSGLRQAVIQADPTVIVDGRFEKMMTAPITVIEIARELLESLAPLAANQPADL
ncbi:MAG: hypothetical protein IT327_20410 [Anaerolineae bacterium]|jgi:hypothetical protein|nr:hypothetical protein [Anaerolineae bacterium]